MRLPDLGWLTHPLWVEKTYNTLARARITVVDHFAIAIYSESIQIIDNMYRAHKTVRDENTREKQ